MRHRAILLPVLLTAATTGVLAQTTQAADSRIYRLTDGSSYSSACIGMCPLTDIPDGDTNLNNMTGTFRLTKTSQDSLFTYYAVTGLNLLIHLSGGGEGHITGAGTYAIGGGPVPTQQMQLDMNLGGSVPYRFDSGVRALAAKLPSIGVGVFKTTPYSVTAIAIVAEPVWPVQVASFSVSNSTREDGCFGPCTCATTVKPVFGTFGLVKLASPAGSTTFSIVDVNWRVGSSTPTASDGVAVTGSGFYQTSIFPRTQRILLQLSFDGQTPQQFDSKQIPGGFASPFRIDGVLSAYGLACLDQVIDLHARRTHPPGLAPRPL